MAFLIINPTDISTVTIKQEQTTQGASLNYTDVTTTLQTNVQVDIQPEDGRFNEGESGGAFRATHVMFSDVYTNVQTFFNGTPNGQVIVELGADVYEIHEIRDYTTHLEYELKQRM